MQKEVASLVPTDADIFGSRFRLVIRGINCKEKVAHLVMLMTDFKVPKANTFKSCCTPFGFRSRSFLFLSISGGQLQFG